MSVALPERSPVRGLALFVTAASAVLLLTAPSTAYAQTPCPPVPTPPLPCTVESRSWTSSPEVELGRPVELGIHYRVACPIVRLTLHVALILDETDRMPDAAIEDIRASARALVDSAVLHDDRPIKVSVIKLGSRAIRLCSLTDDKARLHDCVERAVPGGSAELADSLLLARRELIRGRCALPWPDTVAELLVLYSNGAQADGCDDARDAVNAVGHAGILAVSVCAGVRCEQECMESLASTPRYHFALEDARRIEPILDSIRNLHSRPPHGSLEVEIPRALGYVLRSATPAAPEISPDLPQRLRWPLYWMSRDGVTVTFALRPTARGPQDTLVSARGTYTDRFGVLQTVDIPTPPPVLVRDRATPAPDSPLFFPAALRLDGGAP